VVLPVVAYELPAYRDFYGNSLAYVSTGNVKELAAKIIELLNDADMREKLAKASSHIAKNMTGIVWQNNKLKPLKNCYNR
jgi:glycosyltransferase involved in cell wall biosynthesis